MCNIINMADLLIIVISEAPIKQKGLYSPLSLLLRSNELRCCPKLVLGNNTHTPEMSSEMRAKRAFLVKL